MCDITVSAIIHVYIINVFHIYLGLTGYTFWTSGCYSNARGQIIWQSTGQPLGYHGNWYASNDHGNKRSEDNCVFISDAYWFEYTKSAACILICELQ
jgi:hypothetical protein